MRYPARHASPFYALVGGGLVKAHLKSSAANARVTVTDPAKAALAVGVGIEGLTWRRVGVAVDVRMVKPAALPW